MQGRRASITEMGEALSQADREGFDAGVAAGRAERSGPVILDAPTHLPETEETERRD